MQLASLVLGALLLGAADPAPQAGRWHAIGSDADYAIDSGGDPLADDDARLGVRSLRDVGTKTGGARSTIDAAAFRNGRVVLSAQLDADANTRDAAIWLRVDGESGRLALANSTASPLVAGQPAPRELRLDVPAQAQRIVYGVVFTGNGAVRATALRLRAVPAGAGTRDTPGKAAAQPGARDLFDAAATIVQAHALKADAIDWAQVPARLRESLPASGDTARAHAAIRELLALLGDAHSFLIAAKPAQARAARHEPAALPLVKRLPDGSGYVRIPAFASTDSAAGQRFAAAAVAGIGGIADAVTHGWIVDLRGNGGGNMWPMLAALEPLLGSTELGSFQDRHGSLAPWRRTGATPAVTPDLRRARVAMLIDARTSSSGEIVAVAFHGRADTRSFGQATSGQTSSNRSFALPDGSLLALTTARIVDRNGNVMPDRLTPDVVTPSATSDTHDPALAAAVGWLSQQ